MSKAYYGIKISAICAFGLARPAPPLRGGRRITAPFVMRRDVAVDGKRLGRLEVALSSLGIYYYEVVPAGSLNARVGR